MEDILTMQVWIPRYKYKVWNYNADGTVTSQPQEIEVVFESSTSSTGEIACTDNIQGDSGDGTSEICKLKSTNSNCTDSTCSNKYYTHPAFTFGEEELTGFWIGKFEISAPENSTCYTSASTTNCNKTGINPLVKPDVISYRYTQVGTFETNIMAMNDEGNQYGFNITTDTHMIKNMEWGAVAYLSHSKYGTCINGICQEIGINNNSSYTTGCGAEAGGSSSSTCNSYNTESGMLASTTGNIYGVYDMSGGAYDYAMGNIVSKNGTTMMSGYSNAYNSGYTGIIYNSGNYMSYTGISYPNSKYYDKYSFGTSNTGMIRSKLGDSIKEVYNKDNDNWYNARSWIVHSSGPWFSRSGYYNDSALAGLFFSSYNYGSASGSCSSRFVIIP